MIERFAGTTSLGRAMSAKALAALIGLVLANLVAGDPASILAGGMMVDGDYPNAAAAYSMFVRDIWHWPLGANPNFGNVNAFFSDAAPWFAVLGKTAYGLFAIEIPFHALVLLNFVLFPIMAYRLMVKLTEDWITRWLGVILLSFSLIMPVRIIGAQHIALGSYWVVLWAMSAVPFQDEQSSVWRRWEFLPAIAFAVWSHAYLGAMSAAIILGQLLWIRQWKKAIASFFLAVALLYVFGALSEPRLHVGGAQDYGFDIFAYAQSLNWGGVPMLYPILDLPQMDTIVYLGTGAWLALVFGLAGTAYWRLPLAPGGNTGANARLLVLVIVGAALAVFSMAFTVRVAGPALLTLPLPYPLTILYENFRAVGRFAGVLAYVLVVLAALWLGAVIRTRRVAMVLGILAVGLQFADVQHAGRLAPPDGARTDALAQAEIVDTLLSPGWSGRVYRDLDLIGLEDQRLLDYLLVIQHDAVWLSLAHGARLPPEALMARSGYAEATEGDLVITTVEAGGPRCKRMAQLKSYRLCVV